MVRLRSLFLKNVMCQLIMKPVKLIIAFEVVKNKKNYAAGSKLIALKVFRGVYPVICMEFVFLINECSNLKCKKKQVKPLFEGDNS